MSRLYESWHFLLFAKMRWEPRCIFKLRIWSTKLLMKIRLLIKSTFNYVTLISFSVGKPYKSVVTAKKTINYKNIVNHSIKTTFITVLLSKSIMSSQNLYFANSSIFSFLIPHLGIFECLALYFPIGLLKWLTKFLIWWKYLTFNLINHYTFNKDKELLWELLT